MAKLPREVRTWLTEAWYREVPVEEIYRQAPFRGPSSEIDEFLQRLETSDLSEEIGELVTRIARLEWLGRVRVLSGLLDARLQRVPRFARLSPRGFIEHAVAPNRPVVLTAMMGDWKALTKWTWRFLRDTVGDAGVLVMEHRETAERYDLNVSDLSEPTTLREFIGWIQRVKHSNARYMVARNNGLASAGLKPLARDVGFFGGILDRRRLDGFVSLWVGPGGTVTPLHQDTANNLFCQVRGRKRFLLVDPANAELLRDCLSYYSDLDAERFDVKRYPYLAHVQKLEVTLGPGQALFIPAGWWHHVRSLSPSVSVSMTNFSALLDTDEASFPVPGARIF
ncbi:MAG: cupin-like domain-containing protein [Myxococcaceae bacterium]|nr:cupin-like domain-containing protein [Myxococcaceae bacterium]